MFSKIFKIFQIKKQEIWILLLSVFQAAFSGVFIGSFDISVHAAFVNSYSYLDIPEALVFSGIFGLILFLIYTFLTTRISFRLFTLFNYALLFILSLAVYYFSSVEYNKEYIKYGFALMFPLNIIAFLNYWKSMREIFTPSQSRRLFIFLQIAFYGGIVASGYGTILFLFFTRDFEYIILISSSLIILVILLQLIINPIHKHSKYFQHKPKKVNPIRSKYFELFYTKYTVLLLLFVVLSTIIGFLVHFNFIASTRDIYPDIVGFSKFLGLFTGTLFLMLFFIDKFLVRKILYSYDSPYSLVIIPVAVLFFVIASIVIFLTLGYANLIARFSFYFMIIAIIKTVYEIARYNIEIPSLSVLLNTLDVRFHATIVPRIEGTTRALGILIAGILLFGVLKIKFVNLFYLNILTALLIIGWFFVSILLIKSYKNALLGNIKRFRATKRSNEQEISAVDEKLLYLINHGTADKIISSLQVSEKIEPVSYEKHIISLIYYNSDRIQSYVLNKIEEQGLLLATPTLKKMSYDSQSLEKLKNQLVQRFEQKISLGETEKQIERLANSTNINDRVLAAELIGFLNKKEYTSILINLSRDFEPDVKQASVKAMARSAFAENTHILIGYLNSSVFYSFAYEALVNIGDEACDYLDQIFLAPDADNKLLSRIVKIYGRIGSQKSVDLLLNKIENQNKFIARQAIVALREARFQASLGNINRILNEIVRTCSIMSWNILVFDSIPFNKKNRLIFMAMKSEIEENYNLLFHLLALAYNSNSIANIRKLIDDGGDNDISFAIELLDQIVIDDVKQVLFPLLENLAMKDRIKKLQYFFPAERIPLNELLPEIITRDYNFISIYLKACAIFSWPKERNDVDNILISCLFHPHKLIRETAAFTINLLDSNLLEQVYPRLEPEYITDIQTSLAKSKSNADVLLIEKIEFLKKCYVFNKVSEDILFEVASNLKFRRFAKDENIVLTKNSKLYSIIFLYKGIIEVTNQEESSIDFTEGDLFYSDPFLQDSQSQIKITAQKEVAIFTIDRDTLNILIFDYAELRTIILELIDTII